MTDSETNVHEALGPVSCIVLFHGDAPFSEETLQQIRDVAPSLGFRVASASVYTIALAIEFQSLQQRDAVLDRYREISGVFNILPFTLVEELWNSLQTEEVELARQLIDDEDGQPT